ncbi:MAG: hypothetical protein ACREEM_47170 [Blastocatellia bacterium]
MKIVLPNWLRRSAETLSVLAALLCLVCLIYWLAHPSLPKSRKINALYNWPLFSVCFFWLFCRLREPGALKPPRMILDGVVVILAASRMVGEFLPSSGHALLMSYSLLTVVNRFYRVAAAAMLLLTIAMKLTWGDGRTWVYGIALGGLLGLIYRRHQRRTGLEILLINR